MNRSRKEEERQLNRRLIDLAHEMMALGVKPDGDDDERDESEPVQEIAPGQLGLFEEKPQ